MTPHNRFHRLIQEFLGCESEALASIVNEFVLDADGPVHLAFIPDRDAIAFSTLVFSAMGEPELIDRKLIAEFNGYHLFHGGYRLSADFQAQCLYVTQIKALARIQAIGLESYLQDFIARCACCTRWYAAQAFPAGAARSEPAEVFGAL